MGQTPSKKMGRTRSKELSGNDLSEAMAAHTIRADGPGSAASLGQSPGAASGGLAGSAPIDVGPASPRGAGIGTGGGKRGSSGKGPEKQGSVSSLSSAAGLGSSLGRANSPYDGNGSVRSNSGGLSPNVPTTNTIAASPRGSGLRSSLMGSSPPPSTLGVPGASGPGSLATSPPASPGGRDLSPGNALTATISRNSMVGGGAGQVLDVDNMISRLIEAGYSGKVTKSPPLKIAEINAVCLAAREVFLSQPTLIELSPPVKIVGDVHGQVRGTMPHGWYLPHKHVKRAVLI